MIKVEGFSGCAIRVLRRDVAGSHQYVLEKSTDNPSYVPRLEKQIKKQMMFASKISDVVNALTSASHVQGKGRRLSSEWCEGVIIPEVLYMTKTECSTMSNDGNVKSVAPTAFTVGMRFEHHTDAITFLDRATITDVARFGDLIIGIVDGYLSVSPVGPVPLSLFVSKLDDIERVLKGNAALPKHVLEYVAVDVMPALRLALAKFAAESADGATLMMPVGLCHGDLTLSNLLVRERPRSESESKLEKLILIDFLDSFVESPLADLAKLCQDLKYAWTLRLVLTKGQLAQPDVIKLFTVCRTLFDRVLERYSDEQWFVQFFPVMFVINQLRVVQYCKEPEVAVYLISTIRSEMGPFAAQ